MAWTWISRDLLIAMHDEQLAEHGGASGIRDVGLLESALARPLNVAAYSDATVQQLAASLCYGLVKNHPFIDGNKRAGFVALETFMELNGWELFADDAACVVDTLRVAASEMSESDLTAWITSNSRLY